MGKVTVRRSRAADRFASWLDLRRCPNFFYQFCNHEIECLVWEYTSSFEYRIMQLIAEKAKLPLWSIYLDGNKNEKVRAWVYPFDIDVYKDNYVDKDFVPRALHNLHRDHVLRKGSGYYFTDIVPSGEENSLTSFFQVVPSVSYFNVELCILKIDETNIGAVFEFGPEESIDRARMLRYVGETFFCHAFHIQYDPNAKLTLKDRVVKLTHYSVDGSVTYHNVTWQQAVKYVETVLDK